MTMILARLLALFALPLLLAGCLLTPGKFTAVLDVRADRSFSLSYRGEVFAFDPAESFASGMGGTAAKDEGEDKDGDLTLKPTAESRDAVEAKRRAIAEALRKEVGYRTVEYLGEGRYRIDYATHGRLDNSFLYPFNLDAEAVFPFLILEVRKDGTVRMKAPAFGKASERPAGAPIPASASRAEGTLTLTTDAEIVAQNNEAGAQATAGGKSVVWQVTPLTVDAPSAVLRLKPPTN